MFLTIVVVFFTIIGLLILHELGHFLMAKKFGVKVEEFGIGYPPRIFGKKIRGTVYSFNLLPFGAFVKILGEEKRVDDPSSFSQKPIWQRMLIVLGGVVSFWIIAFLIFSFLASTWGLPTAVSDEFNPNIKSAKVQIVGIAENSPADLAGLRGGETILKIKSQESEIKEITEMRQVQEFINKNLGRNIVMTVKRGDKIFDVKLVPRISPPKDEGPIGILLARVVKLKYPWFRAPQQGLLVTAQQTIQLPVFLVKTLSKAIQGEKVTGVRMVGIVGLGELMSQALKVGVDNFLMFIAIISIWLAFFNILPIPALDGGKLLFLAIEGIRKKPVPQLIEQKITAVFFFALILLMIFITIKDIMRLL